MPRADLAPRADAAPPATSPPSSPAFATAAIHSARPAESEHGALSPSLCLSTAFAQDAIGVPRAHTYARASHPTVATLEAALGALEDAPPSVCFATGMAATTTLLLALVNPGDEVVVSEVVYGGTARLLAQVLQPLGVRATFVDTSDLTAVAAAVRHQPKLLFVETPANPTLRLADVAAAARLARAAGTRVAVDNTFLTPLLLRPLALGADVSLYSTTKYLEGHNATVGGAITTRDAALLERLRFLRKTLGNIQSPFPAWLTLRGLETLPLRLRAHSRGAQVVAEFLAEHPAVARVHYPGLPSFPQAALARAQHQDAETGETLHSGIVSFELHGAAEPGAPDGAPDGAYAAAVRFARAVRLATLAENLGCTRTLVTHPASMTHGDVPAARRRATGISDGLIRLSVGLEHPRDVIADLRQALAQATAGAGNSARSGEEVARV
jgi:cystathionine beta-lyase/cystathionine gamma-synthase